MSTETPTDRLRRRLTNTISTMHGETAKQDQEPPIPREIADVATSIALQEARQQLAQLPESTASEAFDAVYPRPSMPEELELSEPVEEEREGDDFYLCFNCGEITHADVWTYWQPDPDHAHGDAEYRPHGLLPGDSDALQKCPRCGEMHGDCYIGAGVQGGTKAEVEAERSTMLAEPGTGEEWARALASATPESTEEKQ